MKILIINVYSNTRSTGKIAYGLLNYLRNKGHTVKLCCRGTRESMPQDEDIIGLDNIFSTYRAAFLSRVTGIEGRWNSSGTHKLIHLIEDFNPDIVQIYSLHGYYINHYKLLDYLKRHDIPTVYSMIDEFPYMGKCCYSYECNQFKSECKKCPNGRWREYPESWFFDRSNIIFHLKQEAYQDFKHIVFTGPKWVVIRAKESTLLRNKVVKELDEPIDYTRYMYPRATSKLRKSLSIDKQQKVILTVSDMRYWRKGGKYFLQTAERLMGEKDIVFVAIGYNKAVNYPVPQNVITIPFVKSQDELAEFYSLADLFVCTSLADTMPNVCLEALGCGTPLAGFAECGTPYCAYDELGRFTKTYDIDSLVEVVKGSPYKDKELSEKCVSYAHNRYSSEAVFSKLTNIYKELINTRL